MRNMAPQSTKYNVRKEKSNTITFKAVMAITMLRISPAFEFFYGFSMENLVNLRIFKGYIDYE